MKKHFRITIFIIVLIMIFSSVGINIYALGVNQRKLAEDKDLYSDCEIYLSESFEDYSRKLAEITDEQMKKEDFDIDKAVLDEFYSCRIIVQSDDVKNVDFSVFGAKIIVFDSNNKFAVLQFEEREKAVKCCNELSEYENVNFAEPDKYIKLPDEKSDKKFRIMEEFLSWGTEYIHADKFAKELHDNGFTDEVVVAVVDTGVDLDHPFLEDRVLSGGYDFVDGDYYPDDENGHGSHVSGIVVDCTKGLNIKILPVRSIDGNGYGTDLDVENGISYAIEKKADVINLSLGGIHSQTQDYLLKQAIDNGIVVCCAAGNESENTSNSCPAHMTEPIVVSAVDRYGDFAEFSNYGSSVDVAAPGVYIFSSSYYGTYETLSGTSMACPHVAAASAMLKLAFPSFTPLDIENMLKTYCTDKGYIGPDLYYGYGIVNLDNIPIQKHNLGDWEIVTYPTCKDTGLKIRKCIDCGETIQTEVIPVTEDHNYSSVVVPPTCAEKGYTQHTCSVCGKTYRDLETEKVPHKLTDITVLIKPTCYEDGLKQYKCSVCLEVFTEKIDKLQHDFSETVVSPKCLEDGYTLHKCGLCEYSYKTDVVPATGHIAGEWAVISTSNCKVQGEMLRKCKYCETVLDRKYLPLSDEHDYIDTVVSPSCSAGGYTSHLCKNCSKQYIDSFTLPAGHTPGEWEVSVPATSTQDGLEIQKCSVCQKVLDSRAIQKYSVEKAKNTGVVVDEERKFIYGLPEGFSSLEGYVAGKNCTLNLKPTSSGIGTGSVVEVISGGVVTDTYYVVIFGDVSGDGVISEEDLAIIDLYNSFSLEIEESSPYFLAGDVNGDKCINEEDLVVLDLVNAWVMTIDQENPYSKR